MTEERDRNPPLSIFARIAAASVRAKYHLGRVSGGLLLAGAVLDPFVYAGILYFVLAAVFERSGFDRFQFLLIGFISFRWTFSCLLDAANLVELRERMRETTASPAAAAPSPLLLPACSAACSADTWVPQECGRIQEEQRRGGGPL